MQVRIMLQVTRDGDPDRDDAHFNDILGLPVINSDEESPSWCIDARSARPQKLKCK